MKGKLFAIEGADASGKATQSRLLVERLKREGHTAELISFPRYSTTFGKLIKQYLVGELGAIDSLPAEFPALLYALDRYDAMPRIKESLQQGKVVVCDRYSASNIAHQAAKLPASKQQKFIEWIKEVESALPSPILTIYLDVPAAISQKLMKGRERDLHEKNLDYLKKVREIYLRLAGQSGWAKIDCVKGGELLPIKEVHEIIWGKIREYV